MAPRKGFSAYLSDYEARSSAASSPKTSATQDNQKKDDDEVMMDQTDSESNVVHTQRAGTAIAGDEPSREPKVSAMGGVGPTSKPAATDNALEAAIPAGDYEDESPDEEHAHLHEGEAEMMTEALKLAKTRVDEAIARAKENFLSLAALEFKNLTGHDRVSARDWEEHIKALQAGTARVPRELDARRAASSVESDLEAADAQAETSREATRAASAEATGTRDTDRAVDAADGEQDDSDDQGTAQAQADLDEDEQVQAQIRQTMEDALPRRRAREPNEVFASKADLFFSRRKNWATKTLTLELKREIVARARDLRYFGSHVPLLTPGPATFRERNLSREDSKQQELQLDAKQERTNVMSKPLTAEKRKTRAEKYAAKKVEEKQRRLFEKEDPRSIMIQREIWDAMRDRGMPLNRMKEVKHVALARLRENDEALSMKGIKLLLEKFKVSTNGTREQLIRRLAETDARRSIMWKKRYQGKLPPAERAILYAATVNKAVKTDDGRIVKPTRFSVKPAVEAERYSARNRLNELVEAGLMERTGPSMEEMSKLRQPKSPKSKSIISQSSESTQPDEPIQPDLQSSFMDEAIQSLAYEDAMGQDEAANDYADDDHVLPSMTEDAMPPARSQRQFATAMNEDYVNPEEHWFMPSMAEDVMPSAPREGIFARRRIAEHNVNASALREGQFTRRPIAQGSINASAPREGIFARRPIVEDSVNASEPSESHVARQSMAEDGANAAARPFEDASNLFVRDSDESDEEDEVYQDAMETSNQEYESYLERCQEDEATEREDEELGM